MLRRLAPENMCLGKTKHQYPAAAQKQLDAMKHYMNVYRCLYCGHWHIGHLIKPTDNK